MPYLDLIPCLLTFTRNCVKVTLLLECRLAFDANSWKTVWLPRLRQLLQIEYGEFRDDVTLVVAAVR